MVIYKNIYFEIKIKIKHVYTDYLYFNNKQYFIHCLLLHIDELYLVNDGSVAYCRIALANLYYVNCDM